MSSNKYLEKVAATRLSKEVNRLGLPGSGADGGPRLGSAALNKAFTGESPTGRVLSGGTMKQPTRGFFTGRVTGERVVPNTATRESGDILARQPSLQERLKAKKAGNFQAGPGPRRKPDIPGPKPASSMAGAKAPLGGTPTPAAKGLVSRVLGMAKRFPVAAGVAGAGALGGLAYAAGRRSAGEQLQQAYYQ